MAVQTLEVRPLDGPHPQFGAEIDNVDLDNLSDADFETIRNTLYNYHVIVLKNQAGVSPKGRALSKFLIVVKVLTDLTLLVKAAMVTERPLMPSDPFFTQISRQSPTSHKSK
jgi:alpha-ketoglutarate-dependent taurine dioxygenase